MGFINEDIVIDFELPEIIKNTIEEAEELSKTENVEYFGVADILDVLCKNAYANGVITKEQWYTVINRYPI